jgi:hypothetical protein
MTQEAAPSGTATPVPAQRTVEQESAVDHIPTGEPVGSVRPVSFDRLLSVATLTPGQASLIAVQLLEAAQLAALGNGEHPTVLGAVTLAPSGDLDVGRPPPDEGTPVSALLEQLLQNARRLPAHPRPGQLTLLHRLEEAVGDPVLDPGARARALEAALADTLGPDARQRLAGQLAALVDVFAHVAPGASVGDDTLLAPGPGRLTSAPVRLTGTSAAPGGSRSGPRRAASPTRPAPNRPARRARVLLHRRTRGRVALIALVVAGVLAVSGYVVLGGPGSDIVGSFSRDNTPAAPDTTAPDTPAQQPAKEPKPDRAQAVATVAPRHAGAITGVTLQKNGTCTPGALCPVTVTVHFRPASTSRPIGWKVGAAQVCKPGITWSPPVTVTAQPGWTTVYASSSVRVPKGRSLALTAVTTTPDRAQSRPVPATGSSLQC